MASRHNRLNGHDSAEFHQRFRLLLLIIVCTMAVLVVRMWHLQVIKGSELYQRSESNSMRNRTIRAVRGVILDTNRKVLVDNQAAFDILLYPQRAGNVQDVTNRFATLCTERSLSYPEEILQIRKTRSVEPLRIERNISREKLVLVRRTPWSCREWSPKSCLSASTCRGKRWPMSSVTWAKSARRPGKGRNAVRQRRHGR